MPEAGNILVGIKVKKTVKVDVKGPITNYIKRVYGDHMAHEAAESLDTVQELRNQIVGTGVAHRLMLSVTDVVNRCCCRVTRVICFRVPTNPKRAVFIICSTRRMRCTGNVVCGIGMDHFTKYYGALRAIEIRFPVSSDNSHVNISFKWHDAFRDKQTCTQKNIHFEKACVLFCMAAIASQKGLDTSRKTEEGITEAVKCFAQAAGEHT
jgi:hypothetical protein